MEVLKQLSQYLTEQTKQGIQWEQCDLKNTQITGDIVDNRRIPIWNLDTKKYLKTLSIHHTDSEFQEQKDNNTLEHVPWLCQSSGTKR